jgi:hypothetical protein
MPRCPLLELPQAARGSALELQCLVEAAHGRQQRDDEVRVGDAPRTSFHARRRVMLVALCGERLSWTQLHEASRNGRTELGKEMAREMVLLSPIIARFVTSWWSSLYCCFWRRCAVWYCHS